MRFVDTLTAHLDDHAARGEDLGARSTWRGAPRRFQPPTPNAVHFHPPGSLRLPARTKVTGMDLFTRMVEHHIWLIGRMIDKAGHGEPGWGDPMKWVAEPAAV